MNIAFLLDDGLDSTDGVQQYVKTLGRYFISKGHDVTFLVGQSSDKSEFGDRIIPLSYNLKVRGNKNTLTIPVFPKLQEINRVLEEKNFDVIHVQMPYSPLMSQIVMGRAKNIPKVATFHIVGATRFEEIGSNVLGWYQTRSIKNLDKIIPVSTSAEAYAKKHYPVQETKIIPNTVDLEKFKRGNPLKKFDDDVFNIFYLGRLVERKGVGYLLKAYKKLTEMVDPEKVRLVVAGKGYLQPELEFYVKEHNLTNVHFEGYVAEEQKANYYASADVCVFPATEGESFGIVLLEAMAANKLVLAGDNPGYRTVMQDKGALLLFDPKNIDAFAEKLKVVVTDEKMREEFREWGRNEVKKYEVETVGEQVLKVYSEVIGQRKKK